MRTCAGEAVTAAAWEAGTVIRSRYVVTSGQCTAAIGIGRLTFVDVCNVKALAHVRHNQTKLLMKQQ